MRWCWYDVIRDKVDMPDYMVWNYTYFIILSIIIYNKFILYSYNKTNNNNMIKYD